MIKKHLIVLVLSWTAIVGAQSPETAKPNPAFEWAKRLVGGTWAGNVGELAVSIRFESAFDGRVVEGRGTVGDPNKPVLKMLSRVGIDPLTNKVFSIDLRNADSILFGFCTIEKDVWKCDFRALTGAEGHWISYARFLDADNYESTMFQIDASGKESPVHTLRLKRTATTARE